MGKGYTELKWIYFLPLLPSFDYPSYQVVIYFIFLLDQVKSC